MTSATYHLGVDLGTTYMAAAILRQDRAEIVTLGDRAPVVPSVLFFKEDGEVLRGEPASRRGLSDPTRVVREFKRRVGDATPMVVGTTPYSADVLLAELLRFTSEAVVDRQGAEPTSMAITHPANWGPYKIDVLRQAGQIADIGPFTTLSEPVAAAIHYATTERLGPGETVAVYDLGGGTFDAAVLRRTPGLGPGGPAVDFDVLGDVEGIDRLGGIDFDEAVFHHTLRWCEGAMAELNPQDPAVVQALARLRLECVEAKEALSTDTDVSIPVVLPNLQTEVRLTRSEFEAMVRPLIGQTVDALRRAIRNSGVGTDELSAVLLVGGSSRVPLIAEMLGAELGRPIAVDQHPKHTVALGAAIAAGRAAGVRVHEPDPAAVWPGGSMGPGVLDSDPRADDHATTILMPVTTAPVPPTAEAAVADGRSVGDTDRADPSDPDPGDRTPQPELGSPLAGRSPRAVAAGGRRTGQAFALLVVVLLLVGAGVALAVAGADDDPPQVVTGDSPTTDGTDTSVGREVSPAGQRGSSGYSGN
ncbi:MAG: Hsp70 family protein [Actinomycetota bacterium]